MGSGIRGMLQLRIRRVRREGTLDVGEVVPFRRSVRVIMIEWEGVAREVCRHHHTGLSIAGRSRAATLISYRGPS